MSDVNRRRYMVQKRHLALATQHQQRTRQLRRKQRSHRQHFASRALARSRALKRLLQAVDNWRIARQRRAHSSHRSEK